MIEFLTELYLRFPAWPVAVGALVMVMGAVARTWCEVFERTYRRYPFGAVPLSVAGVWIFAIYVWFSVEPVDAAVRASVGRVSWFLLEVTVIHLLRGPLEMLALVFKRRLVG